MTRMRIVLTSLWLAASLTAMIPQASAYFFDEEDTETEIYRNEDFLLVEEEPGADQFYALVRRDGYYKYVKYSAYFNEVFSITNFFELGDGVPKVSAIDTVGRRYFFTMDNDLKSTLYIVGLETGEIVRAYTYDYRIAMMEYDKETERLVGIAQNRHGNNKAIVINTYNGELSKTSDLSITHAIDFDTAFFHAERREVWAVALKRTVEYLMTVHADSGHPSILKLKQVKPEDWLFYNFNTDKVNQIIFVPGTKDSIILAGYSETYRTAFVVHLTIHSSKVKDIIAEVNRKLRDVSPNGLLDYELTIVNGRAVENFIAYSKAQVLTESLKSAYGVESINRKEYFIGQPYNVIVTVDGIDVY